MHPFNHSKKNNGLSTIKGAGIRKIIDQAGRVTKHLAMASAKAAIRPPPVDEDRPTMTITDPNAPRLKGYKPRLTYNYRSAGSRKVRNIVNEWLAKKMKMPITPGHILTSVAGEPTVCSGFTIAKATMYSKTRYMLLHTSSVLDSQAIINEEELAEMGILKHPDERPRKKHAIDKFTALRRTARGLTASDIRGNEYMRMANNEDGLTQCRNCETLNKVYFNPDLYPGMTITVKNTVVASCGQVDCDYTKHHRIPYVEAIKEHLIPAVAAMATTNPLYADAMTVVDHYETQEQLDLLPDNNVIHQYRDIWSEICIYNRILMYRDKILIPGSVSVCAADLHRESHSDAGSNDDAASSTSTISCYSLRMNNETDTSTTTAPPSPDRYSPTMPDNPNTEDESDLEHTSDASDDDLQAMKGVADKIVKDDSFLRVQRLPTPFPAYDSNGDTENTSSAGSHPYATGAGSPNPL